MIFIYHKDWQAKPNLTAKQTFIYNKSFMLGSHQRILWSTENTVETPTGELRRG